LRFDDDDELGGADVGTAAERRAIATPALAAFVCDGVDAGAVAANLGADVTAILRCVDDPDAALHEQAPRFDVRASTSSPKRPPRTRGGWRHIESLLHEKYGVEFAKGERVIAASTVRKRALERRRGAHA
jgi:hypothetical protein